MKKLLIGTTLVIAACGAADAMDEMMGTPDAGAQGGSGGTEPESEFFEYTCPVDGNFVLTDIDFEYGKTVDHVVLPASRYGADSLADVEPDTPMGFSRYSSFSINGKVLAACNGADKVTVEVKP